MVDSIPQTEKRRPFEGYVRELRHSDFRQLLNILSTWVRDRNTKQVLFDEIDDDLKVMEESLDFGGNGHKFFVAVSSDLSGSVLGVVGYRKPDTRMIPYTTTKNAIELINCYVSIDDRKGRGVGTKLVERVEEDARENGYTEIILNSGPRYEKTGWGFYDKLSGYERIAVAKNYYGEGGDAVVWRKEL